MRPEHGTARKCGRARGGPVQRIESRGRVSMASFQHACTIVPQPSIAFADEGVTSRRVMTARLPIGPANDAGAKKAALAGGLSFLKIQNFLLLSPAVPRLDTTSEDAHERRRRTVAR